MYAYVFVVFSLLAPSPRSADERNASAQSPKRLLSGSYLDISYVERLRKTLSPYESKIGMLAEVSDTEAGQTIWLIHDYHEGAAEFFVDNTGTISIPTGRDKFVVSAETIVLERKPEVGEMVIDLNRHTVLRFVGESENFVNREVLCGKYVDDQNKTYLFRPEQIAVFPDQVEIKYTIGLDFITNYFDYITTSKHEVIGFKRTEKKLSLFKTSGEVSQHLNSQPYLQLTRVKDDIHDLRCTEGSVKKPVQK